MKIERGDVFLKNNIYGGGCSIGCCIGRRDDSIYYINMGGTDSNYSVAHWTESTLSLGSIKSGVNKTHINSVLCKIPLTFLKEIHLNSYNHIKEKFLDTNIL